MRRICILALICALHATAAFSATRKEIPGGWYGESLPNGAYAVAIRNGGVETNRGPIASPEAGDGILYVRIANDGVRFAGQSHAGLGSWEWMGDHWRLDPNPAFGVSGLIYDLGGTLRFAVPGQTGSQGFRYVEDFTGRLVTGDATYFDPTRRIHEWTTHADVTVGQGETGCIALRGTDRRLIEPGDCRFVRFNRNVDQLAITMVKLPENKTVILWLNVEELSTFPPEPADPEPQPVPVPTPTPQPSPVHMTAAQLATLQTVRAKYPTNRPLTPVEIGAIINETAWVHRNDPAPLRLQDKPGGTAAIQPRTGRSIWNGLRLIKDGQHYGGDVCGACSVGRFDVVNADFLPADPATVVAPVEPLGSTPTPPTEIEILRARVAALELEVAQLKIAEAQALQQRDAALQDVARLQTDLDSTRQQLEAVSVELATTKAALQQAQEALANVRCTASVFGIKVPCRVVR